ncbi:hypothetical protein A2715_02505 [Candidatus Woesebacteria bacterium RIFCSPHIGHO2_01_FULL_39_32]|uniref:Exosortase/archaeosortase family protein n=1 Tax=Candidatus Woesebacteria bacterium RIFCSPLOWO2_01_FULL_39_25 TaxID=1802521 RepID=A0A1F8BM71_9BACT|nr:MAG: hypothetical protein A2124_02175 [Candidatus Woesebacteria bacterium GWB1_37_5]OGM24025.1 MAG: hypothetical protein A2715_02505 [Candidatus Woesebacteria bacterium RIFCSPHIGHO2_01_FULL_39_32]OGM38024.1 MAG: hypothetical protein A3F01_05815 [Candidatus Woesebacteria bacterium RIFCSPHIGHO2_12_FULL_38_11]OGM64368.1 MAG: hypothetical protein A2893_00680 [Candidatus Woesebacteria bacterium RIFCSPLOWO2_01_FULL_39_25]
MSRKDLIRSILAIVVITLLVMPLVLTFNEILTKVFEKFTLYNLLENFWVPIQVRIVGLVVRSFDLSYIPIKGGMIVNGIEMKMTWNCLGWQSILLFSISAILGLSGSKATFFSKFQTLFLGLFFLFWLNIARITTTVLLAVYSMPIFRIVYHDLFAAILTIFFLIFFWWFSYSFLLTEKI